jgi:hypothetical protein
VPPPADAPSSDRHRRHRLDAERQPLAERLVRPPLIPHEVDGHVPPNPHAFRLKIALVVDPSAAAVA